VAEARKLRHDLSALAFWPAAPIAAALALRDRMRGIVDQTHREFEANKNAAITVSTSNAAGRN
jgi:hypothetical protein